MKTLLATVALLFSLAVSSPVLARASVVIEDLPSNPAAAASGKLLTQDDTVNLSKFISREQLSPTAAYHLVHEQVISPLHSHLTRLIAAWTGCDANDTRMILHTHALIGEILAFRLGKETILLRTGWTAFDEEKTELINQTVTCHIDLILQGLSQRSL